MTKNLRSLQFLLGILKPEFQTGKNIWNNDVSINHSFQVKWVNAHVFMVSVGIFADLNGYPKAVFVKKNNNNY